MPDTTQPYRYIDEDDFCLSARLLPDLDTGGVTETLSITIEGSGEPQSVHVRAAGVPAVAAGIVRAAGQQPAAAPAAVQPPAVDQIPCPHGCDTSTCPCLACEADQTERRDRYAAAIWERQNPGRRYTDCEHPWQADAEEDALAVMAVADIEQAELRARLAKAERAVNLLAEAHRAGEQQPATDRAVLPEPDGRAALARIRAMHQPTEGLGFGCDEDNAPGSYGEIAQVCGTCGKADEYGVRWPCATVRAIDEELRRMADEAQQGEEPKP